MTSFSRRMKASFFGKMESNDNEKLSVQNYVSIKLSIRSGALPVTPSAMFRDRAQYFLYLEGIKILQYHMKIFFSKKWSPHFLYKNVGSISSIKLLSNDSGKIVISNVSQNGTVERLKQTFYRYHAIRPYSLEPFSAITEILFSIIVRLL